MNGKPAEKLRVVEKEKTAKVNRQAQQAYDRREHPDYWNDHEEELERMAEEDRREIVNTMFNIAKGPRMAMSDRRERGR